MIALRKSGRYKLIETRNLVKILHLNKDAFAWPETKQYGEMLVVSHNPHKTDRVLGAGHFRIYEVDDEPKLTDLPHLELEVDKDEWQGYLLLTGLPDDHKQRGRIIPTHEVIAGNPGFVHKALYDSLATAT